MISVSTETGVYTLAIEIWCRGDRLDINASVAVVHTPGKRDAFIIDQRIYDALSRAAALIYVIAAYTEPKINELITTVYGETLPVVLHFISSSFGLIPPLHTANAYIEAYPRTYTVLESLSNIFDLPTLRRSLWKITIAPVYTKSVDIRCRYGSSIAIFVWRPATKEFAGRALELVIPALRGIAAVRGASEKEMALEDRIAEVVTNSIYPRMRDYTPKV